MRDSGGAEVCALTEPRSGRGPEWSRRAGLAGGDPKKGLSRGPQPRQPARGLPSRIQHAPLLVRAPWTVLPAASPGCCAVPARLSPARDIVCVCGDECALGPPVPSLGATTGLAGVRTASAGEEDKAGPTSCVPTEQADLGLPGLSPEPPGIGSPWPPRQPGFPHRRRGQTLGTP